MSSSNYTLDEFIPWALDVGRKLCDCPAKRTELPSGFQLSLYDDTYLYEFSWTKPDKGTGLTALNADRPLTVISTDTTGNEADDSVPEADQEFDDAASFVLEMLLAQDWTLPGIGDWVRRAWISRGQGMPDATVQRRLHQEVVSRLEKETSKRLIAERVLSVLVESASLAALLSFLAPRLVLESRDATLAILRNPELASRVLWEGVPRSDLELLPWVVPIWVSDHQISFEQAMIRIGIDRSLRDRLSQMRPAYLHSLAELLLQFSQPGLARAFWKIAGETVMRDCIQSASPGQRHLICPSVSNAHMDTVWEFWAHAEPDAAAECLHHRPRSVV